MKTNAVHSTIVSIPTLKGLLLGSKSELTKAEVKEALKEAIKEWLDKQFILFGKWSAGALASMALTLLLWSSAKLHGWIK